MSASFGRVTGRYNLAQILRFRAILLFSCVLPTVATVVWVYGQGLGNDFFLGGGGKNVDMPSDCQNLGGHRHIHPLETKSWGGGNCPLAPPGSLAPVYGLVKETVV